MPVKVQRWVQTRLMRFPAPMLMTTFDDQRLARWCRIAGARVVASVSTHDDRHWDHVLHLIEPGTSVTPAVA